MRDGSVKSEKRKRYGQHDGMVRKCSCHCDLGARQAERIALTVSENQAMVYHGVVAGSWVLAVVDEEWTGRSDSRL